MPDFDSFTVRLVFFTDCFVPGSSSGNSPGSSKSAAYALSPLAGSGFAAVFMALIIAGILGLSV